jgi:PilZ domain
MSQAEPNRMERRCGQRFEYQLPVALHVPTDGRSGAGFTQDLSSRGALLWTDFPLREGMLIEMTLVMPSEITLGEDMSVRCRARVLRLESHREDEKPAVAVRIEHYEFLHPQVPVLQQHIPVQVHSLP